MNERLALNLLSLCASPVSTHRETTITFRVLSGPFLLRTNAVRYVPRFSCTAILQKLAVHNATRAVPSPGNIPFLQYFGHSELRCFTHDSAPCLLVAFCTSAFSTQFSRRTPSITTSSGLKRLSRTRCICAIFARCQFFFTLSEKTWMMRGCTLTKRRAEKQGKLSLAAHSEIIHLCKLYRVVPVYAAPPFQKIACRV